MKRITRYDLTAEAPPIQPERHNPLTIEAGVSIPLRASAVWGGIVAFVAVMISILVKTNINVIMIIAVCIFVISFGVSWSAYQRHWLRLSSLERMTGIDLNRDGVVGEPPSVHVTIDERAKDGNVYHTMDFDLPCTEPQLRTLAHGILAGVPFAEGHWVGKNQAFSTRQFRALRADMIKRGMVAPVNVDAPAQGYAFTRSGLAVLRYYESDEK